MKRDGILDTSLVVVSVCALVLTGTAVVHTVRGGQATPAPTTEQVKQWAKFTAHGHRFGPSEAPVTIVEFADFQCPYCRRSALDLKALRVKYGNQVAVVFRHYPLGEIHPQARSAALAAECAAEQGRFEEFHDLVFATQDSLGRRPWAWFARRAGVRDTTAFNQCVSTAKDSTALTLDVADGDALQVRGTPTILINRYRITGAPTPELMDSLVRVVLSHRP